MERLARGLQLAMVAAVAVILTQAADAAPARSSPAAALPADAVADPIAEGHLEAARRLAEKLDRARRLWDAGRAPGVHPAAADALVRDQVVAAGAPVAVLAPNAQGRGSERVAVAPRLEAPAGGAVQRAAEVARPDGDSLAAPRRLQDTRITVILWLTPGTYGIRRNSETADPILCLPDGCYVSQGAEQPARFLPGRRALGLANTWGERAGACRTSLGCVFRDVDLGRLPGYLQPVDLHILKHDRRRGQMINADSTCDLERGRLLCQGGLLREDYALWIVPENLAAAAGPSALERALLEGPSPARAADLPQHWRR
jgi:hypothetical protein